MVSVGLQALILRKHKACDLTEQSTAWEDKANNQGGRKRRMGRKTSKKHAGVDADHTVESVSGGKAYGNNRHHMPDQTTPVPQTSFLRQQIDPETAKYFAEIANAIEGTEIDPEERSVICGNALEETRGKEVELATDYIISHTLQTLLEGCSLDHLCSFLQSCAKNICHIAADRSGSHVVETALKSLSYHLQESENHSLIEQALTKICKAIVVNPVDIMCNCHGSHVLRSLLCLLKGVPLEEFHSTKSSVVLAERLNLKVPHAKDNGSLRFQQIFPSLLKNFVSEMLNAASEDISKLQTNQYSSLVLQTALKLLAGNEQELLHLIRVLLGSSAESANAGNLLEGKTIRNISRLVEETAYSHLMEVIVEFAPETLYSDLLTKVFRKSLFRMSSHHCANFVVQALASQAKSEEHMDLIWEELGTKFHDLFEMGKSGVVASVLAATQRLHSHEHECCQAIAAAVCTGDEFPKYIVPRILFLENFFCSGDKSNWSWPQGTKIHVVGSLILQSIFRLPSELIQIYVTSITSLEEHHVLAASKDPSGSRVIESFLNSNILAKQKRKLVAKLRGHFGELSVHPFGSFTVEKCFTASNLSLRETIVSEMLPLQSELSKTKQGPYLLRKLDIDGFARQPDQWKSRQASQQSALKEFYATFGPTETKSLVKESFLADTHSKPKQEKLKDIRKEIETTLASSKTSNTPFLAHQVSKKAKRSKDEKKRHTRDGQSESQRKKIKV
ncbi:PREDICTED: pumilio homolog 23 isoform X1 [Nicotiana attenuata]|uniref:Pumilio -like 23 n=2 Tax=Nicotiana attenuata TaxID=49451 RepID=A0A1J6IK44_NICAT|nr:PREDICTED: pumilio homolog 23 isoform X1 [Nicotiana attenuata]OIT05222.1 pumilio -like 23 [Nicotiana attenuata]